MKTQTRPFVCCALLAAVCCGSYGSDHCALWLPDQHVVLPGNGADYRSRFRVESHARAFSIRVHFITESGSHPDLEVRNLGPSVLTRFQGSAEALDDSGTRWFGEAEAECGDAFACVSDFEVVVSGFAVEGTLSIEIQSSNCSVNPDDVYLSVEPL